MSTADVSRSRKDDHVRLATEQADRRQGGNDFDAVTFIHQALRASDLANVTTRTTVFEAPWQSPIFINAMTGGTASTGEINAQLARVARETETPIASGSMSRVLNYPEVADTYRVLRTENPDGIVFANLSANTDLDGARRVIELVEADAIQIHINSAQEVVMPEGDRTFSHWAGNIEQLVNALDVPVIVKEVGFGVSRETLHDLLELGVTAVDVSGRGGTNFARIENSRRERQRFGAFDEWGLSTPTSLLDIASQANEQAVTVFASGGVRRPLDVARALALGADAVGVAGGFLHTLQRDGEEGLIDEIRAWRDELIAIQALLGAHKPKDLHDTSILLTGDVREFCELRGIDASSYAKRGAMITRRTNG